MKHESILRRLIYAFLFAVLLAVALSIANDVHAQGVRPTKPVPDVLIPCPDCGKTFCDNFEPYGYWFFFFACHTQPPWNGQPR